MVAETERLIETALASGIKPEFVLHHPDYNGATLCALRAATPQCLPVSPKLLSELYSVETSPGILAVFPIPQLEKPRSPQRTLILDAIREPGNLGTIFRTALAAGVEVILLAPECADPYNPKAIRAAAGAHFRIPLSRLSWEEITRLVQDGMVYLADSSAAKDYATINWSVGPWALIVSNEAHGPSIPAQEVASERLRIPMAAGNDSLNVAAATAIILFEARRQATG